MSITDQLRATTYYRKWGIKGLKRFYVAWFSLMYAQVAALAWLAVYAFGSGLLTVSITLSVACLAFLIHLHIRTCSRVHQLEAEQQSGPRPNQ